eukprot:GHVT01100308.1.p2 GENE.GHVT01100308.1~~GHVT01100308.1.p2  ORF type:complete len:109 (-),score=0.87 GHVT01100308.1:2851-3177(-)
MCLKNKKKGRRQPMLSCLILYFHYLQKSMNIHLSISCLPSYHQDIVHAYQFTMRGCEKPMLQFHCLDFSRTIPSTTLHGGEANILGLVALLCLLFLPSSDLNYVGTIL